jgi:hypothetical protein
VILGICALAVQLSGPPKGGLAMADNEHTSAEIASMAAKVMALDDAEIQQLALTNPQLIRSIAASALTQAADKTFDEALARINGKPLGNG